MSQLPYVPRDVCTILQTLTPSRSLPLLLIVRSLLQESRRRDHFAPFFPGFGLRQPRFCALSVIHFPAPKRSPLACDLLSTNLHFL